MDPRVYKTCIEMLKQRHYNIIEQNDYIIAEKPEKDQVYVHFSENPKFDTSNMKEVMSSININHIIIVYKTDITAVAKTTMLNSCNKEFELFSESDLKYNITKHRLQPVFEKLSDEQVEEFKKTYDINLPQMKYDMPISRFFNYKKKDIIRITRKNGHVTYRVVV